MTEDKAAPAAAPDSRNLVMRIAAAAVLIPLAVAIAYAGGWLWTLLVTLAAIGLFVEWLAIVGLAGATRVMVPGVIALAVAGLCFAIGRLDAALIVLAAGFVAVVAIAPERRSWAAAGFLYAAAAEIASVLVRLDPVKGFAALMFVLLIVWVTDSGGYFAGRGIGGPETLAARQPEKDLGGRRRRICREPRRGVRICRVRSGQSRAVIDAFRGAFGRLAARRPLRIRREAPFWRKGLKSHYSRPRRANGSPGRICRSRRRGGSFRFFAGWRRWRRPRSYGLVKL